jgi:hypothetical protein
VLSTIKTDLLRLIQQKLPLSSPQISRRSHLVVPTRDPTHFAGLYLPLDPVLLFLTTRRRPGQTHTSTDLKWYLYLTNLGASFSGPMTINRTTDLHSRQPKLFSGLLLLGMNHRRDLLHSTVRWQVKLLNISA